MKIFKPETLALLYRHFRLGADKRLSLGLMALFPFEGAGRSSLLSEAELWATVGEAIGKDSVLDEGLPKPTGEFLVYGAAHAPGADAVPQLPVSAQVGAAKKTLYVFGDRRFTALGGISDPVPFRRMPLGLAQAFGGAGHELNPAGKGLHEAAGADGVLVTPLPNVEAPDSLMLAEDDRPPPAGFWPLPAGAPQRKALLGQLDDSWLKKHWPHLPLDTWPEYFQTARADQRIAGFFKGDEALEVTHMHPQRPIQRGALPKLRARCFVNRKVAAGEQFTEVSTRAETVWLLPETGRGIVLYRAAVDVSDEGADDVLHVMAEWENLADAPLPLAHYEQLFRERLAGPAQAVEAPPPATPADPVPAAVPVAAAAVATVTPAAAAASPAVAELEKMSAGIDADIAALMRKNGVKPQDIAPYMKPVAESAPLSPLELEKLSASINADIHALMAKNNVSQADIAKYMAPAPSAPPLSIAEMKTTMQQVERQTASLMDKNGITHADLQKFAASRPEIAHMAPDLAAPAASVDALFAAFPAIAAPAAALPLPPVPQMAAAPAAEAVRVDRDYVVARHARKESFADHDLSGLDLSGLDLGGADFAGAMLEKTSFAGSRLAGADFGRSLLKDADFRGADLSKAGLAGVSAGAAKFAGARMQGSDASGSDFTGADFADAKLAGAKLSHAVFDGAKMAGFSAADCRADGASFNECDLKGADFARANLEGARFGQACLEDAQLAGTRCDKAEFYGVRAARANFTDANLKGSRADKGTQFADARFTGAHLGRANWEGAGIQKALFDKAVLDAADFSRVAGAGAQFSGASAKGANFDKADLANADFTAVNLFKGSLRAARIETAALKFANLYGADFYGTTTSAANTEGSVIDNTLLPIRRVAA